MLRQLHLQTTAAYAHVGSLVRKFTFLSSQAFSSLVRPLVLSTP